MRESHSCQARVQVINCQARFLEARLIILLSKHAACCQLLFTAIKYQWVCSTSRMRLTAVLESSDILREVVYALSFIRKICIFRIDRDTLNIIGIVDGSCTQVWTHLEVTDLFKTLRIQSLDDNRLTFEMSSEIFVRAMKSFSGGSFGLGAVKLKLVKRHNAPYLLLSVDDRPGNSGISRASIFQTVPIRILRADQFRAIKEPETQDADVVLFVNNKLPSILKLCERYKNIGSRVHISANNSGVLKIGVQNDHVKVDTSWTGLVAAKDTARESSENYVSQRDPEEFASVWVDAKELYNVLRIHNSVMNMILCIADGTLLNFVVTIAGLNEVNNITYYLTCYSR
ncbi:checkpoint protein Hus1/Mec3 [Kockiozyma suomiensis]|uniref:checkpoint protein Hus1/Mec3 n=1 Tax=Kockiozyma suomiensis TaxID=1337062 RepID=UPI003344369B